MSNETKKTALPKLRFPEFQGESSWRESKLGEVSEIVRGGSPRPIEDFITTNPDGLNWLKIGDVAPEAKYIFKTQQKVIREALSKTREVSSGDLILSNSMSFGRPYIMKTKSCIHDGWIAIRQIADDVLTDYLYYAISSESSQTYFVANAAGAAVLNLNAERIKVLPLAIPSIEEQQKIADTLSSLDDLITAQNTKLAALQAHKRGLMQSLFPTEGETMPKLRFPEFQGEWVEKKLDEIARRGSGHTPNKSSPQYYNGGIKWVSLADSKLLDNGLITKTASEISMEGIKNSSAVLHPAGTVLISRDAGIGKSAVMGDSMAVSQHFIVWVCNPESLNNWFLYHLLQNSKPLFERAAIGSTIKTIGLQFFKDLVFFIPSFAEQQKTADCLSSLDKHITAQREKIEALKLHKKGLMQNLFPAAPEPTA